MSSLWGTRSSWTKPKSSNKDTDYIFTVIRYLEVGNNLIVHLHYPNCENYNGEKILVFKNYNIAKLTKTNRLDPHFSVSNKNLFARFRPTQEGWESAILLAGLI